MNRNYLIPVACLCFMAALTLPAAAGRPGPAEQKRLTRAYHLISENKNEQAIALMEDFLAEKRRPSHLFFHTLGNSCLRAGQTEKGVAYLEQAVEKAPDFTPAWISLGHGYYALEEYVQSGRSFLQGYEKGGKNEPAHLYHSLTAYYQAEDYQRSMDLFERLSLNHPDDIKTDWQGIPARIHLAREEYEKALPLLEELAEKTEGEQQKSWRRLLLHYYLQLDKTDRALEMVGLLTRREPLEPLWWQLLAHVRAGQGEYEKSVAAMTIGDFLSPLSDREKRALADLNLAAGIPGQSLKIYREMFAAEPDIQTVKKIVTSCLLLHRPEEAMKWTAIGLDLGDDPDLLLIRGNLAYRQENYEEALKAYEKLIAGGHDSGRAWLMLGYAALESGREKRAEEAFRRAGRFDPVNKAAQSALKYLEQKNRHTPRDD